MKLVIPAKAGIQSVDSRTKQPIKFHRKFSAALPFIEAFESQCDQSIRNDILLLEAIRIFRMLFKFF